MLSRIVANLFVATYTPSVESSLFSASVFLDVQTESRPPVQPVTCSTPKRGTELYYRITRTATRERVTRFLLLCNNFKHGFNVSWACIKLVLFLVAPLVFLPPVKPGDFFHV